MKMKFEERFEARNRCRQVVIDYAYYFLFNDYPTIEENEKCKDISKMCRLFIKKGAYVKCQCDSIFYFNLKLLCSVLKSQYVSKHILPSDRYAVITFSSAYEMYGIRDFWTHFICETFDRGERTLYDPYYKYIYEDYHEFKPVLNRERIDKMKKVQVIVWLDKNGGMK